jgi:hypothetical protein
MGFFNKIINDDFVWDALVGSIRGKSKNSGGTNFVNTDCPLCVHRGEGADKRLRLGIKKNFNGVGFNCFNCGAKGKWNRGELIPSSMRALLKAFGMSDENVQRLNLKAMSYRDLLKASPEAALIMPELYQPIFESKSLPKGARPISKWAEEGHTDENFVAVIEYLLSRGEDIAFGWNYYWTPEAGGLNMNRRIIIPFYHEGMTVGYSSRIVDNSPQRYIMDTPPNFLFNSRVMNIPNRRHILLLEGVFDAISMDGVGLLGARLNNHQIGWIKSYGKSVILVPDRDSRGDSLVDTALANNWSVSFPAMREGHGVDRWWDSDVKDAAEATRRYGRIYTLLSILQASVSNKIQIGQLRKIYF